MYVKELGKVDAPLLVFIHGGGVSGWMWDKQVDFFKEYHILIPDLPGHGNNKKDHYVSIRNCAEAIINLIKTKSNGQKVTLIGLSHGVSLANPELFNIIVQSWISNDKLPEEIELLQI